MGHGTEQGRPADRLTHLDDHGRARMVDVTGKSVTHRVAEARCSVVAPADVVAAFAASSAAGEIIEGARYSGIQAAKQTSSLIPLCHPIRLDRVSVGIEPTADGLRVSAVTEVTERTGVEMEALTACAVTALALLQPLLALDARTTISGLTLWHKSGGRSGTWQRAPDGRPPPSS